jgi:formylglycine-generating enzyme required for sulfatase activity
MVVLLLAMLLSSGDPRGTAKLTTPGQTRKSTEPEPFIARPINMKMVLIPAGTFQMGSSQEEIDRVINLKLPWPPVDIIRAEGPQHEVQISQPFYMGIHEVTRGQFRQFLKESSYKIPKGAYRHHPNGTWGMDNNADWENPGYEQTDDHPVVCVSWNDAQEFIKWLNEKYPPTLPSPLLGGEGPGVRGAWKYALPTEAQWEYACRANTRTRYSCGDSDDSLNGHANIADASFKPKFPGTDWARWAVSWDDGYAFTSPAGKFRPNGFGLYDMHGNVWEWCADLWDPNYYQAKVKLDPAGPSAGGYRVIRGGSWNTAASLARCAQRYHNDPGHRTDNFGFRVVLVRAALGPARP